MRQGFKQSHKIKIAKWLFFCFLFLILAIEIIAIVNTLIFHFDNIKLISFLENSPLNPTEAANQYRQILIIRVTINSIIFIAFAFYLYWAFKKIAIGYLFTIFWTFVFVGTILSSWLIGNIDIWASVLTTLFSVAIIMLLFYIFVLLKQNQFYLRGQKRWV